MLYTNPSAREEKEDSSLSCNRYPGRHLVVFEMKFPPSNSYLAASLLSPDKRGRGARDAEPDEKIQP